MDKNTAIAALLPALFLYACDRATETSEPVVRAPMSAAPVQETTSPSNAPEPASPPAGYVDGSGINEGYPDLTPTPLAPEVERTEKGATNVLMSFARALELKEFDQALALLSDADKRKWPKAAFTKLFADLGKITVAFAGGSMEGAAGSSFYTAPLTITAADKDGRPVRLEGEAVLRRVNDVDGATPAQLHWHFESVDLDWTH